MTSRIIFVSVIVALSIAAMVYLEINSRRNSRLLEQQAETPDQDRAQ